MENEGRFGVSALDKIPRYLADNLAALRLKKGMSQLELAKQAEIPRSTLTNIESGSGNPSLQNLVKISAALQVGIEELLSRPRNECELITAQDVPVESRSQGRVRVYKLVPDKIKGLDVDRMEMQSGVTMVGHPHLPGAKEYFSVLQGEVTVAVAGERFAVKKGEVLAFPGDQPHSYRNSGSSLAIGISMIIPVTLGID
jgi:XRE family transcriptional regulator, regulator of sulfur utilization